MSASYIEVVETIKRQICGPDEKTVKIATDLGIVNPEKYPAIILNKKIEVKLSENIGMCSCRPADHQKEYLDTLNYCEYDLSSIETKEEASAVIDYLHLSRNCSYLESLQLRQDDIVKNSNGNLFIVTSISGNGRVYFKGGRGSGSWPHELSVVCRADDLSQEAIKAKEKALNDADKRFVNSKFSLEKGISLKEYALNRLPTSEEIDQLEQIIREAKDERPVQEYLQENPHLFAPLLGRSDRYALSQKRLGCEYVPDFVIGDVSSLGISWRLIELESPAKPMHLKDGETLSENARKGVDQIFQWRQWLNDNSYYAHRSPNENGLGLYGIDKNASAIVLVGQRDISTSAKEYARNSHIDNGIEIHHYDWLIESLRGSINFSGPPVFNDYLI